MYKSHNTLKYLIGITPPRNCVICVKGGRVSDKECGILTKLLPGDEVLADWGFTIYDFVEQYQVHASFC